MLYTCYIQDMCGFIIDHESIINDYKSILFYYNIISKSNNPLLSYSNCICY